MSRLVTIRLEELTGHQTFLPFDIRSFDAVRNTEDMLQLRDRMWKLYEAVDFDFHSPGNSFHRNLLIEVSFHYMIRPYTRLLGKLAHDSSLVAEYHSVIDGLCAAMSGIKIRMMEEAALQRLTDHDYDRSELAIVSDRITYVGIEETIRTYSNIPDHLLGRLKYG